MKREPAPETPRSPGRHRIGAVVERTGLTEHAIRVWERRYAAVKPERTEGGSRLYSDDDVRRLQLLGQLTGEGHAISGLAKLPTAQLVELARVQQAQQAPNPTALDELGEQFLSAIRALNPAATDAVLARASDEMAPRELLANLIAPLATEIGARWARGDLTIAEEHMATVALRDLLTRLRRDHPPRASDPIALAATLSGEKHELGLLMAALLAAMSGWNTVYLGTDLPADQLVDAVTMADARLLLLSMVSEGGLERRGTLRELRDRLPNQVEIIVGGRAAVSANGVWRAQSLDHFESRVRQLRAEIAEI